MWSAEYEHRSRLESEERDWAAGAYGVNPAPWSTLTNVASWLPRGAPLFNAGEASLYWEHSDDKKSIRIVYDQATSAVLGFNLMGIRYRQEVCERWIQGKTPLETVLQDLSLANFDPEFFPEYEAALLEKYSAETGRSIQRRAKRNLRSVLQFLKSSQA